MVAATFHKTKPKSLTFETIFTPLGKGKIVYRLKDGTVLVEFEHGGGKVFRPGELSGQDELDALCLAG